MIHILFFMKFIGQERVKKYKGTGRIHVYRNE